MLEIGSQVMSLVGAINVTLCIYTAKLLLHGRRRKQAEMGTGDPALADVLLW